MLVTLYIINSRDICTDYSFIIIYSLTKSCLAPAFVNSLRPTAPANKECQIGKSQLVLTSHSGVCIIKQFRQTYLSR